MIAISLLKSFCDELYLAHALHGAWILKLFGRKKELMHAPKSSSFYIFKDRLFQYHVSISISGLK